MQVDAIRDCREPVFDRDVLTLDKARIFQTLADRCRKFRSFVKLPNGEEPDHGIADCCARAEPFGAARLIAGALVPQTLG